MFVDHLVVEIQAGCGGNGCCSFRREKYVPRGGPDGGDGGDGGSIILTGDTSQNSLIKVRARQHYRAERGVHGMGKNMHGRNGTDCEIKVPVGTVVRNAETGELLAEILKDGQQAVIQQGGRGGRGNARFATSTNRAPRYHETGEEVLPFRIRMELKLIADVAIVGFPNAGKSTLISRISSATPRIDDYEFTTLHPNLGVVRYDDFKTFVVADIPGLIEGAAEGKGLGIRFLRHIERTRMLLHLLDGADPHGSPVEELAIIREEIGKFNPDMLERKWMVAVNKMDALNPDTDLDQLEQTCRAQGVDMFRISGVTGEGLDQLVRRIGSAVEQIPPLPGTAEEQSATDEQEDKRSYLDEV